MQDLRERWSALTVRQRIIAGVGTVAAAAMVLFMLKLSVRSNEALLYAGLDAVAAGEVIAALDSEGVDYSVRGSSIYVEEATRDRLRLSLAAQNLPKPASEGYELLDSLDGFSTTSEMFSVTYWRAKEGELARTLLQIPGITAARVHIGTEEGSAFARGRLSRTASVTITAPGGLDQKQIRAIRHLTALAVPNLPAESVAIVDTARGLLTEDDELSASGSGRRTADLKQDLRSLLEAHVGPGNARVSVALDIIRRKEEIAERAIDPESATVMARTREEARSSEQGRDRALTVASDLPDGEDADAESASETEEVREEVAFAVSTTERKIELLPGGVARLSVAVLINNPIAEDGSLIERSAEEIETLRALVAAAAGIDEARGDILTIRALPFDQSAKRALEAVELKGTPFPIRRLAELAVVGGSFVLFGVFVLRPILRPDQPIPALSFVKANNDEGAERGDAFLEITPPQDPVRLLQSRSAERPDDAATLLNAWLEDSEEDAA